MVLGVVRMCMHGLCTFGSLGRKPRRASVNLGRLLRVEESVSEPDEFDSAVGQRWAASDAAVAA
jgi:hypothetical protein